MFFRKKAGTELEPVEPPEWVARKPGWERLEHQLSWYDRKSIFNQNRYKQLKILQVVLAVSIPIAALVQNGIGRWITSIAGGLIAIIEAVQHMNQYSTLWVTYRATAERLKHEKFLFLSGAAHYRRLQQEDRLIALAERVEELVSTEHAAWNREITKNLSEADRDVQKR